MTRHIPDNIIERAESHLEIQRRKSLFFSDNLIFENPPWELLLEIYIATEQGHCISIQTLIDNQSAPASIVRRWIDIFADRQYLISCESHGFECVRLTDESRRQCLAYLDAVADI